MTRIQISKNTHPHGEQLSAYIDSMLDVARMRGIGEHLHVCAECRRIEEDLRLTKSLVRGQPAPSVPGPEFWTSAYRALRTGDREREIANRSFWNSWRGPAQAAHRRWVGGLAAGALAVGLFAARPLAPAAHFVSPPVMSAAAAAPDVSPDVTSLAELHTDSVSRLPLSDPDRQKMIAADVRQPEPSSAGLPPNALEAAGYADASY